MEFKKVKADIVCEGKYCVTSMTHRKELEGKEYYCGCPQYSYCDGGDYKDSHSCHLFSEAFEELEMEDDKFLRHRLCIENEIGKRGIENEME